MLSEPKSEKRRKGGQELDTMTDVERKSKKIKRYVAKDTGITERKKTEWQELSDGERGGGATVIQRPFWLKGERKEKTRGRYRKSVADKLQEPWRVGKRKGKKCK